MVLITYEWKIFLVKKTERISMISPWNFPNALKIESVSQLLSTATKASFYKRLIYHGLSACTTVHSTYSRLWLVRPFKFNQWKLTSINLQAVLISTQHLFPVSFWSIPHRKLLAKPNNLLWLLFYALWSNVSPYLQRHKKVPLVI